MFQKEMCNLVLSVVPVVKSKSDPADVAYVEVSAMGIQYSRKKWRSPDRFLSGIVAKLYGVYLYRDHIVTPYISV